MRKIRQIIRCDDGISTIEYAILSGLIALVIIAGVQYFGVTLSGAYSNISSSINDVNEGN